MQFQCFMFINKAFIHPNYRLTAFTAVCHPNYQNLQKVGYDIVIFNGNVLGHAWHTWCRKGTNGKRMSCSLLIGHMQIFKLIDLRTMGRWKWITFNLIHTVYSLTYFAQTFTDLSKQPKRYTSIKLEITVFFISLKSYKAFEFFDCISHSLFLRRPSFLPIGLGEHRIGMLHVRDHFKADLCRCRHVVRSCWWSALRPQYRYRENWRYRHQLRLRCRQLYGIWLLHVDWLYGRGCGANFPVRGWDSTGHEQWWGLNLFFPPFYLL